MGKTEVKPAISLAEKRLEPVEALLVRLRELYAEAKAGKLRGLRYAGVTDDGRYYHGSVESGLGHAEIYALDCGLRQLVFRSEHERFEGESTTDDDDPQVDPETDEEVRPDGRSD